MKTTLLLITCLLLIGLIGTKEREQQQLSNIITQAQNSHYKLTQQDIELINQSCLDVHFKNYLFEQDQRKDDYLLEQANKSQTVKGFIRSLLVFDTK